MYGRLGEQIKLVTAALNLMQKETAVMDAPRWFHSF